MKKLILAFALVFGSLAYVLANRLETTEGAEASVRVASQTSTPAIVDAAPSAAPSSAPAPSAPVAAPAPAPVPKKTGIYRDGTYTGSVADAYYGNIQVAAVISGGKLANVKILQYPNDRGTSIEINSQALPMLIQEAISAQSSRVDTISGATDTSAAFRESLGSALAKA